MTTSYFKIMLLLGVIFSTFTTTLTVYAQSKTGEFNIKATPGEILGSDAKSYNNIIDENDEITWEVYVPENYDPNSPPGIMVYAGAPQNLLQPSGWYSVMDDRNMIWVAARKSGTAVSISEKKFVAMLSVPLIEKGYNIDQNRVYITGQGRTAGAVALDYPTLFKGAIFSGSRIWEDNAENKIKEALENRYVFVTRERSAFPKGTRYAYNKFRKAGVDKTKLILIQGRHRYSRLKFSKSIEYLDGAN